MHRADLAGVVALLTRRCHQLQGILYANFAAFLAGVESSGNGKPGGVR